MTREDFLAAADTSRTVALRRVRRWILHHAPAVREAVVVRGKVRHRWAGDRPPGHIGRMLDLVGREVAAELVAERAEAEVPLAELRTVEIAGSDPRLTAALERSLRAPSWGLTHAGYTKAEDRA